MVVRPAWAESSGRGCGRRASEMEPQLAVSGRQFLDVGQREPKYAVENRLCGQNKGSCGVNRGISCWGLPKSTNLLKVVQLSRPRLLMLPPPVSLRSASGQPPVSLRSASGQPPVSLRRANIRPPGWVVPPNVKKR
jgi:hypothetical protein